MSLLRLFLIAVLAAALAGAAAAEGRKGTAGEFDYYILALSWSPTYCASAEGRPDSEQCREGHDTILHGLWPQYRRGWPEFCPTSHDLRLPASLLDRYDPMTPDRGLLAYQWRKHGVCTGLDPKGYFDLAQRLWFRTKMPRVLFNPQRQASFDRDDLTRAVADANPGTAPDMVVLTCEGRRLDEIRLCLDREGNPASCGPDVLADGCPRSPMVVLPVGGG